MFSYDFMRNAMFAGLLIAMLMPIVGTFLVLKRFSMMGDTLSHSAFAGVALGMVFGQNPTLFSLIYTILCALLIEYLRSRFSSYEEVVMSVVLTFNVGLGILLASSGKSNNISSFLFGSILTVSKIDLFLIALVTLLSFLFIGFFYKKLLYLTFDEEGAKIHGINVRLFNFIFAAITGAAVGSSIRITGLLVISSLLVIPVAAAMNFQKNFKTTMILAMITGLIAVISGLTLSYHLDTAPGGTIALASVACLLISFLFRPKAS